MQPAQCGTMLPFAALTPLPPLLMLLLPMLLRCPSTAAQAIQLPNKAMYRPLGNHPPVQDATEPSLE